MGHPARRLVASDQGGWAVCDDMVANTSFRDAIAIVGSHYPVRGPAAPSTGANCETLRTKYDKPLWTSEGWNLDFVNDWRGAMNLAWRHVGFEPACPCDPERPAPAPPHECWLADHVSRGVASRGSHTT